MQYDFYQRLQFDFDPMDGIPQRQRYQRNTVNQELKKKKQITEFELRVFLCVYKMRRIFTRVSVILCPFSPRCHSHTDIILSGESSIAANNAPLSARLKHKLFTEPANSPYPMTLMVANDTEFHTLI